MGKAGFPKNGEGRGEQAVEFAKERNGKSGAILAFSEIL
jgi:hypothetical protein